MTRLFQPPTTRLGWSISLGALAVLAALLAFLGLRICAATNPDPEPFDQSAYIGMSQHMRDAPWPYFSDGTRNPLFPWLAAVFLDPGSEEFFAAGKRLNAILAAIGAFAVGAFALRRLGALPAWNLSALSGLAVLVPLGTFFGPEPLFYLGFFGMWASACSFLRDTRWPAFVAFGVSTGIATLAKESTAPFLLLTGTLLVLLAATMTRRNVPVWLAARTWSPRVACAGAVGAMLIAAALLAPKMISSQQTFGSPFYSLPSFWFWADDWESCVRDYANCTAPALAAMPPEKRPTAANYFRRHSPSVAVDRLAGGTLVRIRQLLLPEKTFRVPYEKSGKPRRTLLPFRGAYLAGLAALIGILAISSRSRLGTLRAVVFPALLAIGATVGYTLAYAWYFPIGPGARFVLVLYLPILWTLAVVAARLSRMTPLHWLWPAANVAATAALVVRLVELTVFSHFDKIDNAF